MNYDYTLYHSDLQQEIKDAVEFEKVDYATCKKIIFEHHYDDLASELSIIYEKNPDNKYLAIVYSAKAFGSGCDDDKSEAVDILTPMIDDAVESLMEELVDNYKQSNGIEEETDFERLSDFNANEAKLINAEY